MIIKKPIKICAICDNTFAGYKNKKTCGRLACVEKYKNKQKLGKKSTEFLRQVVSLVENNKKLTKELYNDLT